MYYSDLEILNTNEYGYYKNGVNIFNVNIYKKRGKIISIITFDDQNGEKIFMIIDKRNCI